MLTKTDAHEIGLRTNPRNLTIGEYQLAADTTTGAIPMPILTADKLATRARQARFAIDHCTAAPASIEELKSRIAARPIVDGKRAAAYVFGPVESPIGATSYGPHFALGVTDHETPTTFSLHGPFELRSIEDVLADLLEEYPPTAGYDVILANIPATGEMWPAGLKTDYELRECQARARRIALAEGLRHVWYARS